MQNTVELVANAQMLYISAQIAIVPLLLLRWLVLVSLTAHLEAMMRTLRVVLAPLATLAALLLVIAALIGMGIHVLIGDRLAAWRSFGPMTAYLAEQAFVGAPKLVTITLLDVLRKLADA